VPNEDLIGPIDSSDEWIRQRTGIVTRARADKGTDAIDLATAAAAEAIEKSGVPADQVDLVIVATISNPKQTPSVSAIVADRVGANPAAAYDINAACAGYAYAVAQADALIKAGAEEGCTVTIGDVSFEWEPQTPAGVDLMRTGRGTDIRLESDERVGAAERKYRKRVRRGLIDPDEEILE